MENIQTHPQNSETGDESKQRSALLLQFLIGLQRIFRTELDDLTLQLYTAALAPEDPASLRKAITNGVREWKFFPSIAEILERIPRDQSSLKARANAAQERLHAAYKQAKREGRIPQSPYRRIFEPSTQKLLADIVPDRQTRVRLGIEEPQQLSPIEHEMRVAELQKQAAELQEKSGVLHAAAGVGVGLL